MGWSHCAISCGHMRHKYPEAERPEVQLVSYASGSGALSFTYTNNHTDKSAGCPTTVAEVANDSVWSDIQANIANFDHILADFGSAKYPHILAFSPVRRIDHNHLRMYAYGKIFDCRYEKRGTFDYAFWSEDTGLARLQGRESEVENWSMRGIMKFFLENEAKCTEALELRDLREFTQGKTHLVPLVTNLENAA